MDASRIDRINELYHKSQSVGLTEEEKEKFLCFAEGMAAMADALAKPRAG